MTFKEGYVETDKDGNVKTKLEDKDNHFIDCTRYALESDMRNSSIKVLNKNSII